MSWDDTQSTLPPHRTLAVVNSHLMNGESVGTVLSSRQVFVKREDGGNHQWFGTH